MSLAEELHESLRTLDTACINDALRNHNVEEITQFIISSENFERAWIKCPPVNEKLGRRISDAIVHNSHIRELFIGDEDLVAWIGSCNTLVNMTSLEWVVVVARDMSVLECSALFPLLLTSPSLRTFEINYFQGGRGCTSVAMNALSSYLLAASLREFIFLSNGLCMSAAVIALCNGVALSTVQRLTLSQDFLQECNLERLALMIAESSLKEVMIEGQAPEQIERFISALKLTAPVRNMDFAFTQIGDGTSQTRLRINRKWKPLVFSANTPLAFWPHILEIACFSRDES